MIPLQDQQHLETLFRDITVSEGRRSKDGLFFIYFTASWCGPCRRLDKEAIQAVADELGVPLYICDAEKNDYSPGYCGVRTFPSFVAMVPNKHLATVTSSKTETVCDWMREVDKQTSASQ